MPQFNDDFVESNYSKDGGAAVVGRQAWAGDGTPGSGGNGGWFESSHGEGVRGWAKNPHHAGTVGVNTAGGFGVYGTGDGHGVVGESSAAIGVFGRSTSATGGNGGWFESVTGEGVRGWSKNANHAGVVGVNDAGGSGVHGTSEGSGGVGVYGKGGRLAAFFEGDVEVTGDIRLGNADCAEDFDVVGDLIVDPGTVMIMGDSGALEPSARAYDRRVAGVVSGAGNYRPGIILDGHSDAGNRSPIALLGKTYCRADARYGPIAIGDLLTTSDTPGSAMKASDAAKTLGSVIGKALRPLTSGQGLIPILVALQ